jgi:hypothetical protein
MSALFQTPITKKPILERYQHVLATVSILATVISFVVSARTEQRANEINSLLTAYTAKQYELDRKSHAFDVINVLYHDFYQFDQYNPVVMQKLQAGERISKDYQLGVYLNGFEDVYEQCKSGVIQLEDVRINFQYLLNPVCDNQQVSAFARQRSNGLKILCAKFYPQSILGKAADLSRDSCR